MNINSKDQAKRAASKYKLLSTSLLISILSACGVVSESPTVTSPDGMIVRPPSAGSVDSIPRDWVAYRDQAARKIMQSNAKDTFSGALPAIMAAIPSLNIEVNADGSVRDIEVTRTPAFYPETIELAKAAIRRAAPFGSVRHLSKPWEFRETFLFNDDFKFQLHTLQPK